MSLSPSSGSIAVTRPRRLTWRYQSSVSSTVNDTRGSARRCSSRARLWSRLTSTRLSSHRYQVATLSGPPPGLSEAITAGLGSRNSA